MDDSDFIIKKREFASHQIMYMVWYPQQGYHNGGWAIWKWDARSRYWRYLTGQAPCCNPRGQLAAALRQLRQ
jgi:hypothetical protein